MIYTFYSYKGGAGRSMALANVAELLYEYGLKVLMIDFDLEAPGLERFFLDSDSYRSGLLQEQFGVIDLLNRYKTFLSLYSSKTKQEKEPEELQIEAVERFFSNPQNLDDFIKDIYPKNSDGGELFLMPSGYRVDFSEYSESIQAFDWNDFYAYQAGRIFFDKLIEKFQEKFNVILIDSRTGITEMGGVCTHHLADAVIMFVVPTDQSAYGIEKVAASLKNPDLIKKRSDRKVFLVFVPSRVDNAEGQFHKEFQKSFEERFIADQNNHSFNFQEGAFSALKIPYVPYYAFQEELAVRDKKTDIAAGLRKAYKNLALTLSQLAPQEHPFYEVFSKEKISNQKQASRSIQAQDWGNAPDAASFFGREQELETLRKYILEEQCRIVAILGMGGIGKTDLSLRLGKGGIGKTDLSLKLARGIEEHFEYVIWRSLRQEPELKDILSEILRFLSKLIDLPDDINTQIDRLLELLKKYRCLLIFDNAESILQKGTHREQYEKEHENYGILLRKIGETEHQSCLIITSREKHPEIAELEKIMRSVRSLHLNGLDETAGKQLIESIAESRSGSLTGTKVALEELIKLYNGNPLALKLAANYIIDVYSGNVNEFLKPGSRILFEDIQDLLNWHFERLSEEEKDVMYWLAINQKPISILELQNDILSPLSQGKVDLSIQSLQNRLSIQKRKIKIVISQPKSPLEVTKLIKETETIIFSLHPVIMEYMIDLLVSKVTKELIEGTEINLFNKYALLKATTGEYLRASQCRLILEPIKKSLIDHFNSADYLETELNKIIKKLQKESPQKPGYAGGNLVNFLYDLTKDLNGRDFSSLAIRQAYLQGMDLKKTNLSDTEISQSIFTNKLSHVLSVALSPQGNVVATGDSGDEICLWNVADGHLLQNFKDHNNWVWSVKFCPPDGKKLASASDDKTVRIWDVMTGQQLKILTESLEQRQSHDDWVRCVAFDREGICLASGSDDKTIKLWDVETGKHLKTLNGHEMRVWSVAFSPDGQFLVSGSDDTKVILWNLETDQPIKIFEEHKGRVQAVAFSSYNKIASGSADATVRIWDVSTKTCLNVLSCGENRIWGVAFRPNDEEKLAVASDDRVLRIYDINTLEPFRTFIGHKTRIRSVAFTSDGSKLASGSEDKTVKIWDVQEGKCLQTFEGQTDRVWSVAFSHNGNYLVNGSEDQKVRLWSLLSNGKNRYECIKEFSERTYWVWSVDFHTSDSKIIATGSDENIVKIWNVETGTLLKELEGHTNWILSVAFSPDGKVLASGSEDNTVKIWDINTEDCLQTFEDAEGHKGHTDRVRSVAFHPDGKFLASGSDDRKIIIWKWNGEPEEPREFFQSLPNHQSRVRAVTFSPNGDYLASSSDDKTIRIWKSSTDGKFQECQVLEGHTDKVVSVAFSPDGKTLASGSDDTTVRIWNVQDGKCLKVLRGHTRWVRSVAFRPDGEILASSSQDETIKLWDLKTYECYQLLQAEGPYHGMKITGIKGLSKTEINTLKALGAVDDVFSGPSNSF
jgi:WD40 repeat protein/cellulose biosynthesis protein BcsQ